MTVANEILKRATLQPKTSAELWELMPDGMNYGTFSSYLSNLASNGQLIRAGTRTRYTYRKPSPIKKNGASMPTNPFMSNKTLQRDALLHAVADAVSEERFEHARALGDLLKLV